MCHIAELSLNVLYGFSVMEHQSYEYITCISDTRKLRVQRDRHDENKTIRRTVSLLFLCAAFWRTYKIASDGLLLTRVQPSFDPYAALSVYFSIINIDAITYEANQNGPV